MLIGDSGVGKTCLLVRFKDNAFLSGNFISTVGIDFRVSSHFVLSVWFHIKFCLCRFYYERVGQFVTAKCRKYCPRNALNELSFIAVKQQSNGPKSCHVYIMS